ncbi:competence protein ComK [Bacillus sp. CGMCC 1.16607]|uniref:competence protein ComK n=1 Tax=Bacillus sp. CGMCC 1.16607 TaxID=3351842 RepID=UPI003643E028
MLIKSDHIINQKTLLIKGEYALHGMLCTRVMVENGSFLVNKSPSQLLEGTLNYIGFNLKGAVTGARFILRKTKKCPIILNPYQGVCMFPITSPHKMDNIWFNPMQIKHTRALDRKTEVLFYNGHSIIVDSRLKAFNDKITSAKQLIDISSQNGNSSSPNPHESKKGYQLIKDSTGHYNFDLLTTP